MGKRTDTQARIYETITRMIREQGYAPSVREIGKAVGLKSPSTVHFHLQKLEEAGLIEKPSPCRPSRRSGIPCRFPLWATWRREPPFWPRSA